MVQYSTTEYSELHEPIPGAIQAVLQEVVAKLCTNKETCIFHNCFYYFLHPLYICSLLLWHLKECWKDCRLTESILRAINLVNVQKYSKGTVMQCKEGTSTQLQRYIICQALWHHINRKWEWGLYQLHTIDTD